MRGNDFWLSWRDGTQRKTNRYIDPSKQVCVRPRTRRRGSVKTKIKTVRRDKKREKRVEKLLCDWTYLYGQYSKLVPDD